MALARHANQRDTNEPQIVKALQKLGASVYRIDTPCDLIVGVRGRTVLLEVKGAHGSLTLTQRTFAAVFRGEYHIVMTPEEAVEAVFGPSQIVGKGCR